jgi:hypothetical protein
MLFGLIFKGIWTDFAAAFLLFIIGWLWGQWRSRIAWLKKEFKNRVLISLNILLKKDDKLRLELRTIYEDDIMVLFSNHEMVKLVNQAIEKATPENPILDLKSDDAWYILNVVLNKISQHFAKGLLRKDMGLNVTSKNYIFTLAFEKEGGVRVQKLRILLIDKEKLLNFPEENSIELESEKHKIRIETIRIMKRMLKEKPYLFMDIEICS